MSEHDAEIDRLRDAIASLAAEYEQAAADNEGDPCEGTMRGFAEELRSILASHPDEA